jgi:hypothetical protein
LSITIQHTKEQLCNAHLTAIACRAGVNLHLHTGVNDYGVDGSRRRETGFGIDFQAKSSVKWMLRGANIIFDLESNAYNDLVLRSQAASTFIVILLCLPRVQAAWHEANHDEAIMRNACYWLSLQGQPTLNSARIRVQFPLMNLLTAETLAEMLAADQAAREALFNE